MYGDMIYCMHCCKVFKDTWTNYDSRVDKVENQCPFCHSVATTNASKFIDEYEASNKHELGGKYGKTYEQMRWIYQKYKQLEKGYLKKHKKMLVQEVVFYPTNVLERYKHENDKGKE